MVIVAMAMGQIDRCVCLQVGSTVEVRTNEGLSSEAVISKLTDASLYTVGEWRRPPGHMTLSKALGSEVASAVFTATLLLKPQTFNGAVLYVKRNINSGNSSYLQLFTRRRFM